MFLQTQIILPNPLANISNLEFGSSINVLKDGNVLVHIII